MNETFKPFQQVLVRGNETEEWVCGIYSHHDDVLNSHCAMGAYFKECIPYEGNEQLLGTTDSPFLITNKSNQLNKYESKRTNDR